MTRTRCWLPGLLVLAVALAGCGGGHGTDNPAVPATTEAASALATPAGEPYVDYHPGRITVEYSPGLRLPARLASAVPTHGRRAQDLGNRTLRTRPDYEQLTNAIAARCDLTVRNQVYTGRANLAGFDLPEGADGAAVLAVIRSEFAEFIDGVRFSRLGRACYLPDDPAVQSSSATGGDAWQVHRMNFPAAWDRTLGDPGVTVAVLDTGVRLTHEELTPGVLDPQVHFPDYNLDVWNHDNTMEDPAGHGTSVASLIVATADNGRTIAGGAPGCRVIPIRVTDDGQYFDETSVVEGAYLARDLGADIVNLSLVFSEDLYSLGVAMQDLADAGILVLAAAGNFDDTGTLYPAGYPTVMSVGATLYADERAVLDWWGSEYGPDVEIAAPGEYYVSAYNLADSGPDAYWVFGGTSGATPLVAAVAALGWSLHPELTAAELRSALVASGSPTTGFWNTVPRADAGGLLDLLDGSFRFSPPDTVYYSGTTAIGFDVTGEVDWIEAVWGEVPLATLTGAPWTCTTAFPGLEFGTVLLEAQGLTAGGPATTALTGIVDNTPGAFPLVEDFDGAAPRAAALDLKYHAPEVLEQLYNLDEAWFNPATAAEFGPGTWQLLPDAGPDGSACYYFGDGDTGGYGGYEVDLLLLPVVDLRNNTAGSLTFQHRYNIDDNAINLGDLAAVVINIEGSPYWGYASLETSGVATYRGYQPDWATASISLGEYWNERVRVGFLFISNREQSGSATEEPAGWWVDNIELASGFEPAPELGYTVTEPLPGAMVGAAVGLGTFTVSVTEPTGVARMTFELDLVPVGSQDDWDLLVEDTSAPFAAEITLPDGLANQAVRLYVQGYDDSGRPGLLTVIPLSVLNLRGDTNGDGMVDQADHDGFAGRLWAVEGDAEYDAAYDSDGDGVITEADAGIVGYYWGAGSV